MIAEEHGENGRRARFAAFLVLAMLLTAMVSALPPAEAQATGGPYELNIEVDYYEGLLWPEVIEAFDFLVAYFEGQGIKTEVDFNSTNNVIEGSGHIYSSSVGYDLPWRTINYQYHDRPETHIHFIVAKTADRIAGGAPHLYGAAIGLDVTGKDYDLIRFVILHEIGHCIGIGLHDDTHQEVYSGGFMGFYRPGVERYTDENWESAFAPDGAYGDSLFHSARIWNRFSVLGEIWDDTGDVTGIATGEAVEDGPVIYLKDVHGLHDDNGCYISSADGTFSLIAKPGNYTLEMEGEYRLSEPIFVNVTEREVIHLGNVAIERIPPPPPVESPPDPRMTHVLAAAIFAAVLFLAFALWTRKRDANRPRENRKIMVAAVITAVLLLLPSYIYLGPNDIYDAVTVNEFFDDIVDRNGDGVIDEDDYPINWHSYKAGDRVVVRDRIKTVDYFIDGNNTLITLVEYSGKYGGREGIIYVSMLGDLRGIYQKDDIIMVENKLYLHPIQGYDHILYFRYWDIVD